MSKDGVWTASPPIACRSPKGRRSSTGTTTTFWPLPPSSPHSRVLACVHSALSSCPASCHFIREPPWYEYHGLVNVRDRTYGTSLLHAAARSNDVATVKLLLAWKVRLRRLRRRLRRRGRVGTATQGRPPQHTRTHAPSLHTGGPRGCGQARGHAAARGVPVW